MSTLTQYKIFCNDEQATFNTDFLTGAPRCPNNSAHTIDPSKTTILTQYSPNTVAIDQGTANTQGLFRVKGFSLSIPAGQTITKIDFVVRKYTTTTITGTVYPLPYNVGDDFSIYTKPDFLVGALTSFLPSGSSGMTMDVVTSLRFGGYLKLIDTSSGSTVTCDLGECQTITGNYVTFEVPTTFDFPIATGVYQSITNILNHPITSTQNITYGKLSGQPIRPNTSTRISYHNADPNLTEKSISLTFGTIY